MPRVSGIYSRPTGIDAVANNTIDSGKYNSNVADVEADLNLPRPIISGGTGATDALGARANLSAEVRGVQVTDYNTQVWESGSFWSDTSATGGPVASHVFTGTCQIRDATYITLEARDLFDTTVPGRLYVRQKLAGVWGPWKLDGGLNSSGTNFFLGSDLQDMSFGLGGTAPNSYFFVNSESDASGLTLFRVDKTGTVVSLAPFTITNNSSGPADLTLATNNIPRWLFRATPASNFDFQLFRHDNAGAAVAPPALTVSRTDSAAAFAGAASIAGAVTIGSSGATGWNALTKISFAGGGTQQGLGFRPVADSTNAVLFLNAADAIIGTIFTTATTTAYNTSSDGTLKEDLQPAGITAGQILNDTEIYNFKWKGTDERAYGVIAQQAAPIYAGPFTHDENADRWFVDYSKYVPILIQEAKTLKTRIVDLETKLTAAMSRLDVLDRFREKIEAL